MKTWIAAGLAILLGLSGCDLTGPGDGRRVVGLLQWQSVDAAGAAATWVGPESLAEVSITVPETVTAGVPFSVEVRTVGADGCWREDGEHVTASGTTASITPYDRVIAEIDGEQAFCATVLVSLIHTFEVTFEEAGSGALEVSGRIVTENDLESARPLEHSVAIEILPAGT